MTPDLPQAMAANVAPVDTASDDTSTDAAPDAALDPGFAPYTDTEFTTAVRSYVGYLSPPDSARFLGIGVTTLWRYLKNDPSFPQPARPSTRKTLFPVLGLVRWAESKRGGGA